MSNIINLLVPAPTLSASMSGLVGDGSIAVTVPVITLSATASSGSYNTFAEVIPAIRLTGQMTSANLISAALEVPAPILRATLVEGNIGSGAILIPPPVLLATCLGGSIMSAALTVPAVTLVAAGYPAGSIAGLILIPPPQLTAFMGSPIATNFRSWVLNTRKGALTEYDNFNFNSYAYFNGQVLACGSSGVVVLGTQADDNGVAIRALGRTGKSDYQHSWLKRVPRLYLKHKADGDLLFRTITAESGTRTYLLPTNHTVGFQQRRVQIGKGPKAAFWQYEFENVDGADFTIQGILVYPINLRRRVM